MLHCGGCVHIIIVHRHQSMQRERRRMCEVNNLQQQFDAPPGSLMRLKNEPSAVNMRVLLKDVTRPMADSAPNQLLCSMNEDAPAGMCAKKSRQASYWLSIPLLWAYARQTQQHLPQTVNACRGSFSKQGVAGCRYYRATILNTPEISRPVM
jgi:hypothetical protein